MSYRELPVQMHHKYQEFLKFMAGLSVSQNAVNNGTAFWAWLKAQSSDSQDVRDFILAVSKLLRYKYSKTTWTDCTESVIRFKSKSAMFSRV